MKVFVENGVVMVTFDEPVKWIGLPRDIAIEMANALLKHAAEIPHKTND
jgi:hypothetical protein